MNLSKLRIQQIRFKWIDRVKSRRLWLRWLRIFLQCQETWIWSLGQEDPLENGMQPTSIFLPEESWTVEPGGLKSMGSQRVGHNWATKHNAAQFSRAYCAYLHLSCSRYSTFQIHVWLKILSQAIFLLEYIKVGVFCWISRLCDCW